MNKFFWPGLGPSSDTGATAPAETERRKTARQQQPLAVDQMLTSAAQVKAERLEQRLRDLPDEYDGLRIGSGRWGGGASWTTRVAILKPKFAEVAAMEEIPYNALSDAMQKIQRSADPDVRLKIMASVQKNGPPVWHESQIRS